MGIYTVGYVNEYIKNMFATDFLLRTISVRGEVSNCKYHYTGHIYFSIKDESGILGCMMYSSKRQKGLDFTMEEGQKVIVTGRIDVFTRDGNYKLYADKIEKEGTGDLYRRFLELKAELEEMGMFSSEYKKPIPRYATTIGVVTSAKGAAFQDIRDIATRRNPYVQIVLYHAKVQGEGAASSIAEGIEYLDHFGVDVIIAGRGGGSIEDLWAFNEEIVARAIFGCHTPVISAVGHETDFTIADLVADLRAPTPSAAAELAVFRYEDLMDRLDAIAKRLDEAMMHKVQFYRNRTDHMEKILKSMSPFNRIEGKRQLVSRAHTRMDRLMEKKLADRKHLFELLSAKLNALSPLTKLSGGYAYVSDSKGKPVMSIDDVDHGEILNIYVKDGNISVQVEEKEKDGGFYGWNKDT